MHQVRGWPSWQFSLRPPTLTSNIFAASWLTRMYSTSFERSDSYLFGVRSPRLWFDFKQFLCWVNVPLFHIIQRQMDVSFFPRLYECRGGQKVSWDVQCIWSRGVEPLQMFATYVDSRENQTFSRRSKGNCPEPLSSLFGDGKQISSKHSLMTQKPVCESTTVACRSNYLPFIY